MALGALDYALLSSIVFYFPVLLPMLYQGPIATFDDLLPGVLTAADRSSQLLLHVAYIDMGRTSSSQYCRCGRRRRRRSRRSGRSRG